MVRLSRSQILRDTGKSKYISASHYSLIFPSQPEEIKSWKKATDWKEKAK